MTYIEPKIFESKFTCPHCSAIAFHRWEAFDQHGSRAGIASSGRAASSMGDLLGYSIRICVCDHCNKYTIWQQHTLVYPEPRSAPPANPDMPAEVKKYYDEAAMIASKSPRSAAALLRLAVQVLCKELGEPGKNINDDIASLVKKGLSPSVQKSLDIVRVTGNNAVHPGTIDVDDPATVSGLFTLLNIIVDYMISMPKKVDSAYGALPANLLDAIQKRDNPTP